MRTLADIQLRSLDRQAIEASARLVRERFPVVRIVLFGSKARGADDHESDIDLLLLTSRPLDWRERSAITDSLFDVELAYGVVISTFILPAEEWDHGPYTVLPIRREIEREGARA
jgi:predicted nucleotidyltransferase